MIRIFSNIRPIHLSDMYGRYGLHADAADQEITGTVLARAGI